MNYKILTASANPNDVLFLSNLLHADLEKKYGKGKIEGFIEENKKMIEFHIVYNSENKPVACGALKKFNNSTAEIKRMFVINKHRGKGISKLILSHLEDLAGKLNYKRIVLETGIKQPEAISLYTKFGYTPIKCYGKYSDDDESRCFEKLI
ncbi:MAG TPA: GNAT family N-acetyltransferase [Ignavibacteriales bacterium]|nr:GNAT family N-acetyltransferase [Ignavibacteriales bacterium]